MKPLAAFVVLALSALLVPSSLNAQMRGMSGRGGSGGAHVSSGFRSAPSGGFRSAGPGGFRSAPGGFRSGPGFHTFAPAPRRDGLSAFAPSSRAFASRGFVSSRHVFVNRPFGFRRFHHRHFGFFDSCFGCSPFFFGGGFGTGLFLGSPFFPFFPGGYYGDYYGYGPPAQQEPVVVNTDNGNSAALSAEVQRLTDEVEDLRSEENRRYYEDRNRAGAGAATSAKEPAAATTFVFRDGRRITAQNYAIAGQTLWIFNEREARKYQMADLDAAATEQVNAANGVEFHVPAPATKH